MRLFFVKLYSLRSRKILLLTGMCLWFVGCCILRMWIVILITTCTRIPTGCRAQPPVYAKERRIWFFCGQITWSMHSFGLEHIRPALGSCLPISDLRAEPIFATEKKKGKSMTSSSSDAELMAVSLLHIGVGWKLSVSTLSLLLTIHFSCRNFSLTNRFSCRNFTTLHKTD